MSDRPLLLIEDTASLQMVYENVLRSAGHDVVCASTATEGIALFEEVRPPVVLLDLTLPDRDGLHLMQECLRRDKLARFIVITANGTINRAVEAMRAGAYEFLVKPFDEQRFLNAIENALTSRTLAQSETQDLIADAPIAGFIGSSPVMREVYAKIRSVSGSMATVFITGESGTGKEICAQAVHLSSNRSDGPFVPLNCGAIPPDHLESEVFGHLKGSFPGAISDHLGAAAAADGGTLFLDDVCEMDLNLQAKLLRFIQTSMIHPVGAQAPRKVNVRIICATNRNPVQEVRAGNFREDLFYRLQVVPIHMPPLRERGDDVIEIAEATLRNVSEEEGRHFMGLSEDVKSLLREYSWPGNIRQLLNVIRNVVVLNDGPVVTYSMLPIEMLQDARHPPTPALAVPVSDDFGGIIGKTLAEIERLVIERTIAKCGGSVPKAARMLDVSPSTLYRKREAWAKSFARSGE